MIEEYGSVTLTNGSGSGRPKTYGSEYGTLFFPLDFDFECDICLSFVPALKMISRSDVSWKALFYVFPTTRF